MKYTKAFTANFAANVWPKLFKATPAKAIKKATEMFDWLERMPASGPSVTFADFADSPLVRGIAPPPWEKTQAINFSGCRSWNEILHTLASPKKEKKPKAINLDQR